MKKYIVERMKLEAKDRKTFLAASTIKWQIVQAGAVASATFGNDSQLLFNRTSPIREYGDTIFSLKFPFHV